LTNPKTLISTTLESTINRNHSQQQLLMSNVLGLPLESENINIRRLGQPDWALFCRLYTDKEVMAHIGKPYELKPLKTKFEQRLKSWHRDNFEWLTLVIELANPPAPDSPMRKDHASIGLFGIRCINIESRIVEMYMLIEKEHSGHGHASETLARLTPYIFYNLNYHKIVACCTTDNITAQQTLEHNGFIKEGTIRQNSFIDEHFVDDYYYGLLIDDHHR